MQDPSAGGTAPSDTRPALITLLQNRPFAFYTGNRLAVGFGQSVQTAALAWQVYEITGSALSLAFVGLARFVPQLILSFLGGAVADAMDRRVIIAFAQIVPMSTSTLLFVLTAAGVISMGPIYGCVILLGLASAFEGPARESLLAQVVTRSSFQRAVALSSTLQQLSGVVGPATAGVLIAQFGLAPAYLLHVIVLVLGLGLLALVKMSPGSAPTGKLSVALIVEGIVFIRSQPALLGAMAIDMFAVIFASAEALLPIFAKDILDVGAFGFGMLSSSKAVGAFAMACLMVLMPPIVRTGRALILTIFAFALATMAFGLSTWFPLSVLLYGLLQAFDQVSVVVRRSIIQLGTPDALRGRVNAVSSVFINASNQLGAVRGGLVTAWFGSAQLAVVSGGVGCIIAVAIIALLIPSLWRHRVQLHEVPAAAPQPTAP